MLPRLTSQVATADGHDTNAWSNQLVPHSSRHREPNTKRGRCQTSGPRARAPLSPDAQRPRYVSLSLRQKPVAHESVPVAAMRKSRRSPSGIAVDLKLCRHSLIPEKSAMSKRESLRPESLSRDQIDVNGHLNFNVVVNQDFSPSMNFRLAPRLSWSRVNNSRNLIPILALSLT